MNLFDQFIEIYNININMNLFVKCLCSNGMRMVFDLPSDATVSDLYMEIISCASKYQVHPMF